MNPKHRLITSIVLFIALFSIFHMIKPGFAYNEQGGFRPFGLGYQHKTIFPAWVVAILLAIFSYTLIMKIPSS